MACRYHWYVFPQCWLIDYNLFSLQFAIVIIKFVSFLLDDETNTDCVTDSDSNPENPKGTYISIKFPSCSDIGNISLTSIISDDDNLNWLDEKDVVPPTDSLSKNDWHNYINLENVGNYDHYIIHNMFICEL